MTLKDKISLEQLYQKIYVEDYLYVDEDKLENYNLEEYLSSFDLGINVSLLEDFQKIEDGAIIDNIVSDVYKITLNNGKVFNLYIGYNNPNKTYSFFNDGLTNVKHKESQHLCSKDLVNDYQKAFNNLKDGNTIAVIQFKDDQERHQLTGEVGYSTMELFQVLKSALLDSFSNEKYKSTMFGLMMRVSNSEIRRLSLYKKLLEKYIINMYPNIFVDDTTEKDKGYTLLISTK